MTIAARLWSGLAAVAVLCAVPYAAAETTSADAASAGQARVLLQRMNSALAQRNYIGTLRHVRGGRSETVRIVHRVRGAEVTERIVPLDGSQREFIRRGPEVFFYLPDQGVVLVERRPRAGGLLTTLPQIDGRTERVYSLQAVKRVRQQGRAAHLVTLAPRDGYRYGYRIWIDERTSMPLKTELRDPSGAVLEEVSFSELQLYADIPDSAFEPAVSTANLRWYRSAPVAVAARARPAPPVWVASSLPPGFRLTQSTRQNLPGADGPVEHLVFSDGIASVSVFIGAPKAVPPKAAGAPDGAGGASTTYVTRVEGRPVTVVGEVPLRTARLIAAQVRRAVPAPAAAAAPTATAPAATAPTAGGDAPK